MSFHVFFAFSSGLTKPISVPKGTKKSIIEHIESVEKTLGLQRTKYESNPVHWDSFKRDFSKIEDKLLCETVRHHNLWVMDWYANFEHWAKHPFKIGKAERITPKDAQEFWHGFQTLSVPTSKWTADYYRSRMESLYEVMRGRESEGVSFDEKPLTPKQAASVIGIFDQYLDPADLRLDVPNGHDYLASPYDGGYEWCEKCGAVDPYDGDRCRKRKCPIREERKEAL